MPTTTTSLRTQFFDYLFGDSEGYVCIATSLPDKKDFKQTFFKWPEQRSDLSHFLEASTHKRNVWFCTSLLEREERKKEYCLPGMLVWADLDACHPSTVSPTPSAVIESSPRRYQAIWRLDEVIEPSVQEDFSKRIAYKYATNGADPSGWDLTQLLRVPLTYNYKYESSGDVPMVALLNANETRVPSSLFYQIERATSKDVSTGEAEHTLPDIDKLPQADWVIYRYYAQLRVNRPFLGLYQTEPSGDEDWSRSLWRLMNICFEVGMSDEETFVIALNSKCNKYARDNRPVVHLWEDVLRASAGQRKTAILMSETSMIVMPELVTREEIATTGRTFIDDYCDWAESATDAVAEFHPLTAVMLLSSIMAAGIKLETDYGTMIPNLWGLVLGDSTLSRKTTAMRMGLDMLLELDPSFLLATDGSAEGLLSGLAQRPNIVSLYFKDEVSGFFDSINRKDYLAGMPETLTHLYDVPKVYTRRLRKETITITNSSFIFFGGGIRDKVYSLISDEYILSGFLPRFLIVSGDTDLAKIRRTGPRSEANSTKRAKLQETIANLYETYNRQVSMTIGGQAVEMHSVNECFLTTEAWERYGDIEEKMVKAAFDSSISALALPTFERLSRSLLKMSMLIAASKTRPENGMFQVEEEHVIKAASYIQRWGNYTIDLLVNSGKGATERTLDKVLRAIEKRPSILRSDLMRRHHLTSREADDILKTLEERGQIISTQQGRGYSYRAV